MCRLTDKRGIAYKAIKSVCKRFSNRDFECQRSMLYHPSDIYIWISYFTVLKSNEQLCLDSLRPKDYQESDSGPAPNTCEWILSLPKFHAWRNGKAPILWLSGELGHGKTTLMCFLKNRLWMPPNENKRDRIIPTVCSYFFDARSEVLSDVRLVLRKILWDILSKRHDLMLMLFNSLTRFLHGPVRDFGESFRLF